MTPTPPHSPHRGPPRAASAVSRVRLPPHSSHRGPPRAAPAVSRVRLPPHSPHRGPRRAAPAVSRVRLPPRVSVRPTVPVARRALPVRLASHIGYVGRVRAGARNIRASWKFGSCQMRGVRPGPALLNTSPASLNTSPASLSTSPAYLDAILAPLMACLATPTWPDEGASQRDDGAIHRVGREICPVPTTSMAPSMSLESGSHAGSERRLASLGADPVPLSRVPLSPGPLGTDPAPLSPVPPSPGAPQPRAPQPGPAPWAQIGIFHDPG